MVVTILQWNARSIFKKLPEFKKYLSALAFLPDVICIEEIHLSPKYNPILPATQLLRRIVLHTEVKAGDWRYA